jgi:hypothetical protein
MAHSPQTQAAVLAALMMGKGIRETAREFGVPRSTVQRWRRQVPAFFKRPTIVALVMRHVELGLETLSAQFSVFGNADWLSRQNARELAILHMIVFDKLWRLWAAFPIGADRRAKP